MKPGGIGTVVETFSRPEELRTLVPQWEALAAEAADANPFYEPWMMLPALEAFGAEGLRCVAVWEDGTLGAIFPLQLERRWRGLPVRALRSWRHRNMLACTPLVRAKTAAKCIGALLQAKLAPVIEFDWTGADGFFYGALAEAASAARLPWLVTDAYARAILVRGRDPRARFNSNMRNNLKRWESRLRAAGKLEPVRLEPGGDLERWTREFMALEASGWKGKAGTALSCREDDRRFVAAAFPEGFRRGKLHITGLDLDGKPLSRHLYVGSDDGAFTLKIAYDEAHASCSPGIVGEADNARQFQERSGPQWLDSNTAAENTSYGRVWKDRRTVQRVAVGLSGTGRLAVAALPLVRAAKNGVRRRA